MHFSLLKKLLPLPANLYSRILIALAVCAFGLLALLMFNEITEIKEAALNHNKNAAAQEMSNAVKQVFDEAELIATNLIELDEVRQQFADPNYYEYWYTSRSGELGLPKYLKHFDLYNPEGRSLLDKNTVMPTGLLHLSAYLRHDPKTGVLAFYFKPVFKRVANPADSTQAIGQIGLTLDFPSALLELNRFRHIERNSIRVTLPKQGQFKPSAILSRIDYKMAATADTAELELAIYHALAETGLLLGVVALLYHFLVLRLFGNPLRRLVDYLEALRQGEDTEMAREFAGESLAVSELETLRSTLTDYQRRLARAQNLLLEENRRMAAELDVARRIQQMVLPRAAELQGMQDLDIAAYMEAADEIGGDYYDVFMCRDEVVVAIGDVTGHGLESGVLMLMVQSAVRALMHSGISDAKAFLNRLNSMVYDNIRRADLDRNLSFSILFYSEGRVRVAGQHEEIILVRGNGQTERFDTLRLGLWLGLRQDIASHVGQMELQLEAGESLVLYTDGITEAFDGDMNLYGVERLCEVLSAHCQAPASMMIDAVVTDMRHYAGETKAGDDITLLILKRKDGDSE